MVSNRVVLLLCGSFSPITNLHLRMLGEFQIELALTTARAYNRVALDEVTLIIILVSL